MLSDDQGSTIINLAPQSTNLSPASLAQHGAEDTPAITMEALRDTSPLRSPSAIAHDPLQKRPQRQFMDAVVIPTLASLKAGGYFAKVTVIKAEAIEALITPTVKLEPMTEDDKNKLKFLHSNVRQSLPAAHKN
jgi:hypothetical protein